MNDTHQSLEEILFNLAVQKATAADRAAFLDHACRNNPTLRTAVEELLESHFGASGFLTGPASGPGFPEGPTLAAPAPEAPAEMIGRYKMLERIGEGGFGEVWMAEQREPVKRRVALKILKPGMDSRQIVARFEAERQALAMMDHPNIARIYDAGTTDSGRPYFVMELVRGTRITEYCDQHQLTTARRLDLFIKVCHALQHAHQKGIIHRDIKPSNVLVTVNDGAPVPKVIDFGIAKATQAELTDKTVFTQFQQFIGTPAYISPEQAEMSSLDIDTRADIYSLGVLLYELLVGQTPFDAREMMQGGFDALRKIIREREPQRPSTRLNTLPGEARTTAGQRRQTDAGRLVHQLQGDLDWIVMKCLEKDRTRRYETANGLAADIRRHLESEPVMARPPSFGYRLQKTVRRHRSAFATAGIVLIALLFGLGFSVWQAVQKSRALARMTEAEQAQSHSREVAEKALSQEAAARQRVNELLERETAARRAGEARLYATDIHLAQQAIDQDNFDRARELLARHYPRPGETNRPGWEWRHLWQELQDDPAFEVGRITNNIDLAVGSSASPDHRWLVAAHRNDDRAWIDVMDIVDLRDPRKVGEVVMPSTNFISGLALGNRNGLIAHAQASTPVRLMAPGVTTTIGIHDATTQRALATITNLPGLCFELAWSGDGQHLLMSSTVATSSGSATEKGPRIDVWHAPDLTHVTTLTNFGEVSIGGYELGFAVTADASAVAVVSPSGQLSVIDVATGAIRWSLTSQHRGFGRVALKPDGRTLFAMDMADPWVIRFFDVLTGKELGPALRDSNQGDLSGLVLSPDGRTLGSTSSKGFLCFWDVGDLAQGPKALPSLRSTSGGRIHALLPDGRTVLTRLWKNGTVLAWDRGLERPSRPPLKVAIQGEIARYQVGADNRTLLIAARDGAVTQRHGPGFQSVTPLFDVGRRLGKPVFSADGRWFAAGSSNGFVEVWNVPERRRVQRLGRFSGTARAEQFSEDGSRLIVLDWASERYAEWDWAQAREVRTFPKRVNGDGYERDTTLSSDGRQVLALTGKGGFTWIDTQTQETRSGNLGLRFLFDLEFAPGARQFVASCYDGFAHLHDSRTFERIATLGDGTGSLRSVQFLDGGGRVFLASAGLKSQVALWDAATQLELLRFDVEESVGHLQISPDGGVLTGDSSPEPVKEIHLWRAPSWEEIERAEAARPSVSVARPR